MTREHVTLPIAGMTCASCAGRVERALNDVPGVIATVNAATERASVDFDPDNATLPDLVAAVRRSGYDARIVESGIDAADHAEHADRSDHSAQLARRVVVAAALTLPVVAVSMAPNVQFAGWRWWALAVSAVVTVWCGWPFHRAAWMQARHRSASMDTLVSIGTLAAFGWSTAVTVGISRGTQHVYFETACVVTTFLLAGRALEHRAKSRAGSALRELLRLGARDALLLTGDGDERAIPIDQLHVGDRFVVRPGTRVATDGIVESGGSALDVSHVTGESMPVDVSTGDEVLGASLNTTGRLVVRATRVGNDTALAQIARMVEHAQSTKAPVQRLADRVARVFVPTVLALAAATLIGWFAMGAPASQAFEAAVATLIIACPCALGLATPTALLAGTGRGAQLGIVIRGADVLESTRRVDTIVLDKTGTLTHGAMQVTEFHAAPGVDVDEARALVVALERASEHPVAHALVAHATACGLTVAEVATNVEALAGRGISGNVGDRQVVAGSPSLLRERGFAIDAALSAAIDDIRARGWTVVAAGWDGRMQAAAGVSDTLRDGSRRAVERLRELGVHPVLATGDTEAAAAAAACDAGIDDIHASMLPAGKAALVARLQSEGRVVAVAGDGVNDSPALARADLGIAMGSGTDAAMSAADITLMSGGLMRAPDAIRLARRTLSIIRSNLFWAFAYNVAAIPLAMAGKLDPMIAGAAMACSSIFVVLNSLRLRRFRAMP